MRTRTTALSIFVIVSILAGPMLYGQETDTTPAPYEEQEFPDWAWDLRRGEIIATGVFPFSFFLTRFFYSVYRYAANDFSSDYTPRLFRSTETTESLLTEREKRGVLLVSVGVSVIVAFVDYYLGRREEAREKNKK